MLQSSRGQVLIQISVSAVERSRCSSGDGNQIEILKVDGVSRHPRRVRNHCPLFLQTN